ncbi:MAG: PhzF family phenazine biosynthesis protein [Acidimicrobiales bacterium]
MSLDYVVCDVFTDRPFTGNQLAVFTDAGDIADDLLQALAREINFSETTFIYPPDDPAVADARVRIFTPAAELPFAGHPVLGTAVVLGERLGLTEVRLACGAGVVPVSITGRSGVMVQPVPTVAPVETAELDALLAALGGVEPVIPVARYDNGVEHLVVVVGGAEEVGSVLGLVPNFGALASAAGRSGTSVVAGSGRRWTSRAFAPGLGVNEDPATGSAAGPIAAHLCRYSLVPWGDEVEIHQGQAINRPSRLLAMAQGSDDGIERVEVGGDVVVVGSGSFDLSP